MWNETKTGSIYEISKSEYLSKTADEYIACVEKEFKYQINFRRDKKEIERMILYTMDPKGIKYYYLIC